MNWFLFTLKLNCVKSVLDELYILYVVSGLSLQTRISSLLSRWLSCVITLVRAWYLLLTTEVFRFTSDLILRLTCRAVILLSFVSPTRTSLTTLRYAVSSWDCDVSCVKETKQQLPSRALNKSSCASPIAYAVLLRKESDNDKLISLKEKWKVISLMRWQRI